MRRIVFATVLFGLLLFAVPPSYAVGPTPSLITDPVTLHLDGGARSSLVQLQVQNDGTAGTITLQFRDDATGKALKLRQGNQAASRSLTLQLKAHTVTRLDVRVTTGQSAIDGHVLMQPVNGTATIGEFHTSRTPATSSLWLTLIGSAVALLLVGIAWLYKGNDQSKLKDPLAVGADWKFNESWASNTTALVATTGIVLGLSGFLDDVLHGVVVTRLVGLDALFLAAIAAAPLVFAAFRTESAGAQTGTVFGFLVASWLTLSAAFGELAVLGLMLYMARADASHSAWLLAVLLVAAFAVLAVYGFRTVAATVVHKRSEIGHGSAKTLLAPAMAKSKAENGEAVRVALL